MLCDELWILCVQRHQQDLLREAAQRGLQQRARAQLPRRSRPRWQAFSHALSGCKARLYAFWWRRQLQPVDAPAACLAAAEEQVPCAELHRDLVGATARTAGVSHH